MITTADFLHVPARLAAPSPGVRPLHWVAAGASRRPQAAVGVLVAAAVHRRLLRHWWSSAVHDVELLYIDLGEATSSTSINQVLFGWIQRGHRLQTTLFDKARSAVVH